MRVTESYSLNQLQSVQAISRVVTTSQNTSVGAQNASDSAIIECKVEAVERFAKLAQSARKISQK